MASEVEVLNVAAQWVAYRRLTCDRDKIGPAITAPDVLPSIYELAKKHGVQAGPPYARYLRWGETDCDLQCGVPLTGPVPPEDNIVVDYYTSCRLAMLTFVGPYSELGKAHDTVIEFIKANGYTFGGPCWEVYDGPGNPDGTATTHVCYAIEP